MLIKLYNHNNRPEDIEHIVHCLNDGGVAIIPTDTAYAIACCALKEKAVDKICRLKAIDPKKQSLSIICYDISEISTYAKIDNSTFKVLKRCLPGPYTFILNGTSKLPKIFKNRKEIGIRMPDMATTTELAKALKTPIMCTTLPFNIDVDDIEEVTNPELIEEAWGSKVDIVIDGGIVPYQYSTIVDCTGDAPVVVRTGLGEIDKI